MGSDSICANAAPAPDLRAAIDGSRPRLSHPPGPGPGEEPVPIGEPPDDDDGYDDEDEDDEEDEDYHDD